MQSIAFSRFSSAVEQRFCNYECCYFIAPHGDRKLNKINNFSDVRVIYCLTVSPLYSRSLRAKSEPKMSRTHLTDIVVSRLKTPGTYFDETTPAFGIRVGKNRKTWIVMRGVERLRVRIGHYPAVSLADARKEARKLLTEEPAKHAKVTFEAAYEVYKEALTEKKPRTQRDYKRMIEKYLVPKLGKRKLGELEYEDVIATTTGLPPSEKSHCLRRLCR
jgi:hypothetical protein